MGYVWPRLADVPVHLAHHTNVLVAVQQRVLLLALDTHVPSAGVGGLVGFETGVREDDDQALRVLISRDDRDMLLGHQLRQFRRREGLGACHDDESQTRLGGGQRSVVNPGCRDV